MDLLKAAQQHAPVDVLFGELCFQRPDLLLQPGHKRHVVCIAPKEGHGQVSMSVDKARDGQLAVAVDGFILVFVLQIATDLCYACFPE